MTEDAENLRRMLGDTVVLIAGQLGDEAARTMLQDEIKRLKRSRPRGRPHDERGFNQVVASLGRATKKAVRAETPSRSNFEIDRERNARKKAQERFASRFAIYLELIREFARERGMATNFEENDTAFLEAVAMLKTGRRDF